MNWDDLRFVLALARAGSLARAARVLSVDHTTVGRRIEALEAALGVGLFARTTNGYVLTQEAERLLPSMRAIEDSILALERGVGGRDTRVRGTVRLTTGEAFGSRFVAPRLADFARRHPEITVELVTSPQTLDLARREADVALRFFRSPLDHLVARRIADIGFGIYASEDYLARRGTPKALADLQAHDAVGVEAEVVPPEDVWFERVMRGARFVLRTNSSAAMTSAARSGMGLALLPCFLGDAEPTLRRVQLGDAPVRNIWLTVHRDLQRAARVRALMDYLVEVFRADAGVVLGRATGSPAKTRGQPSGSPAKTRGKPSASPAKARAISRRGPRP